MSGELPEQPSVNHGIQQSGGHMQIGNQAVGRGAQAVTGGVSFGAAGSVQGADAGELLALIERLLTEHRDALPEQDGVRVELRRLREELEEAEPQPGVLRRALERLTSFVQPVAPLVVAAGQLAQAVEGALGH
ncbi:hypothetical protein [Kitasatospora kifunensis]|uniref:Uncharacterized protein n=1 Tax=Kitasatospora kifunensis TaxID=58351 RepID=A0A7W7R989_KITKI|nr:hypothetical protein [Kitasatospora kifunensis]MBB4927775.1 hypothetical protein [Kitasatospora kifunensis]